jgi:Bifunctional DNA primase/polymerase, N-terminal/DnaB-like helicase C terminal domain
LTNFSKNVKIPSKIEKDKGGKMSNACMRSALWYAKNRKWSVIAVGKDKKPLFKWEQYQKRLPTEDEIKSWWDKYPDANVAIVTGKVSNLAVIDIDDKDIDNEIINGIEEISDPPTTVTPRGGRHLYFKYPDTYAIRNAVSIIPKVDIRGEGGYVIAPPSINGDDKNYFWKDGRSIIQVNTGTFPESIIKLTETTPRREIKDVDMFTEGRRDEDLFHFANVMLKGGAKPDETRAALRILASQCDPPFPENELSIKIESAMKRLERKERVIADEIKRWVNLQDGYFDLSTIKNELSITSDNDKNSLHVTIKRLFDDGIIEKYGKKAGCYRAKDLTVNEMDWENAPTKDMNISYPLRIEEYVATYPSNIIVIAGAPNSGKTTFLLDMARRNANRGYKINYLNSEMGEGELKMRLGLFQNASIHDWKKIKFIERGENFDDIIRPDEINIIDYLEVLKDFWMVGEQIKKIHNKLTTGIAIIAIQKSKGADLGRGGSFGTEKPRLYLSMDFGKIRIVKAKNWRAAENPNGMVNEFTIGGGWKFIENGKGWHIEEDTKDDKGGSSNGKSPIPLRFQGTQ